MGAFAFAAYRAQPALSNVIYGINGLEYGSKIIDSLYQDLKNLKNKNHQFSSIYQRFADKNLQKD